MRLVRREDGSVVAVPGRRASPPVTPEEAVAELWKGGYEPLEPFPGKASALWRVRCRRCGQPRTTRLTMIRSGRRCAHAAAPRPTREEAVAELARFRLDLVDGWDGLAATTLTLRCRFCGEHKRLSLADVRHGRRCGHQAPRWPGIAPQEAVEEMRECGFEPLEPYPGRAAERWRQRCLEPSCGQERVVSLAAARRGRRCAHRGAKRGENGQRAGGA